MYMLVWNFKYVYLFMNLVKWLIRCYKFINYIFIFLCERILRNVNSESHRPIKFDNEMYYIIYCILYNTNIYLYIDSDPKRNNYK